MMGRRGYFSPYAWGTLLSNLLEHKLATLLSQADIKRLSEAEATTVLYEQLRSFMALKSTIKSSQPQSDILRPAHEALLNFAARLFMAAHQALLNDGKARAGKQPSVTGNPKWQHSVAVPASQFLLEWQLVRLKAARERLILELADLSERHQKTFRKLKLSHVAGAEVESARYRVSSVWKKIPKTARWFSVPAQAGRYAVSSS